MRQLIPDTLRGRIVASFLLLFLLVTIPAYWFVVDSAVDQIRSRDNERFQQQIDLIAAGLSPHDDDAAIAEALDSLTAVSHIVVAVYDGDGALVASSAPPDDGPPAGFPAETLGDGGVPLGVQQRGGDLFASAAIPDGNGAVIIGTAEVDDVSTSTNLWVRAFAVFVAALVVFGVVGRYVVRRLTDPLLTVRDQALAMVQGEMPVASEPDNARVIRDLSGAIGVVTARVQELERENMDARRRLELIFEHLREGVIVVDADEIVVAENPRAREILGNEGRPGSGLQFTVVVRDHDLIDLMRRSQASMEPSTMPIEYARSGRSIEATTIPMEGERGVICVVVVRDVTDIRRLELVRREFVANVSHELRTPLASIRALADTLESGALDDQEVAIDFLRRIVEEVDRLTALVEELLDLARLQAGRISLARNRENPAAVIQSGVDRLKPQIDRAGLTITMQLADDLPAVSMDKSRIEQVIINLLHNAIKFTPAGGTIEVVATASPGGVQVDIRDSGAGIPEEDLARIFERFYKGDRSRRSEGSGLGLAISNHIIRAHQGEIWAKSALGEGSTFSFSLPTSVAGSQADALRGAGQSVSGSRTGD